MYIYICIYIVYKYLYVYIYTYRYLYTCDGIYVMGNHQVGCGISWLVNVQACCAFNSFGGSLVTPTADRQAVAPRKAHHSHS